MSRVNVPLSNLRAIVILIVVAFHSLLPYLASQPNLLHAFNAPPYRWIAFPIIDHARWFGFDPFCAWQDLSLMSLMFLLAGLFTPASLGRKGSLTYLAERWRRLGLPFFAAAGLLSPLAYFAAFLARSPDSTVVDFWRHWLALPMWPSGPAWFLWQLLVFNALAAALHAFAPHWRQTLERAAAVFSDRPLLLFVTLVALSMVAYVPLAMAFTPWDWAYLGPFSFQLSRPLHDAVYFFAGFAIGSHGCDRGVLRRDGPLARRWPVWLATAAASFAVWGALTSLTLPDWNASPLLYRLAAACAFPLACAGGVFCLPAIALRLMSARNRLLDSLSANAYGIYLLHYVVVVWLQYALLPVDLNAIGKVAIVFPGALVLSWAMSAGIARLPLHSGHDAAVAHQPR